MHAVEVGSGVIGLLLVACQAVALSPAAQCESRKLKAAGTYAACRMKVEARAVDSSIAKAFSSCDSGYVSRWQRAELIGAADCPTHGDSSVIQTIITQYVEDLAAALSGERRSGQQLQTGQVDCSDANGSTVSCAGSGQDGEFQAGLAAQYVDNGDGTVSDPRTGLMWEKLSDDGSIHDKDSAYRWADASTKIALLNSAMFAGYGDWRVPKAKELQSIVSYGAAEPSVDPAFNTACALNCTVLTCSCTAAAHYWSSTPLVASPGGGGFAWMVSFHDGVIYSQPESNLFGVRAVRGGS